MKCKKCGEELVKEQLYCPKCGYVYPVKDERAGIICKLLLAFAAVIVMVAVR